MSSVELKKARDQRKAQGYDPNPPLCMNCKRFVKPMRYRGDFPYQPPFCSASGLNVSATAVCDFWTGKRGETLE